MCMCINEKCPYSNCPMANAEDCSKCKCIARIDCDRNCRNCEKDCDARLEDNGIHFECDLVMQFMAKRFAETDGACDVCVWKDKCSAELDAAPDGEWNPPDNDVCAENIVKYFKKLVIVE